MMKQNVVIITIALLSIFLVQCKEGKTIEQTPITVEETTPVSTESVVEPDTTKSLVGTYEGIFPWEEEGGEEMESLKVTAVIKDGNKYMYKVVSSTGTHTEEGEWELDKDRLYLREDEYSAAHAFLVKEDKLYFLDSEGEVVNETESGNYILVKK
ncbi:hypothetical protein [Myroides marinus]|uniref:hypothetical protein n=2 Tax=Myroides marinus TaxID=703342 RepID=UPI0025789820|nr:hypothetical protein [Myroides marinus]